MSKAIKQIVVVAAVVAISMVFIIQFRPGTNVELGGGPTCAVEISGECIAHSDFVTSYRLAAPNVDPEILKQLRMRELIVEGLIERWLLLKDAERLGVAASSEEVTRYIAGKSMARFSLPAGQEETFTFLLQRYLGPQIVPQPLGPARRIPIYDAKTKNFDYERYQRWVQRSTPKTEKDFKEFQRKEIVAARMRALVRSRVRVSELEARKQYEAVNEKITVDYVKLERAYYKDHVIDASKAAVDAWLQNNGDEVEESWTERKDQYLPECRKARHLVVRIDETNPDKEAASKAARDKAEAAKARIEGGETFAAVAREISEDANTKDDGGALGCFAKGKLSGPSTTTALDEAIFTLDVGGVSDVIETQYGFHLVTVDAALDAEAAEKLGRREVAKDLYLRKEAERLAAEGAKQILAAVKDGKTLQEALDAHLDAVLPEDAKEAIEKGRASEGDDESDGGKLNAWDDPSRPKIRTSDPFTSMGPPFSQVEKPADAAQSLFRLEKVGDLPDDVIKLYDGYAVAQLKERQPVTDETWKKDRVDYMAGLRRKKQQDALVAYVQRLRSKYGQEITYRIKLTEDSAETDQAPPQPGG
jgi:peptidyl-prolyl cis-trans isomerase D